MQARAIDIMDGIHLIDALTNLGITMRNEPDLYHEAVALDKVSYFQLKKKTDLSSEPSEPGSVEHPSDGTSPGFSTLSIEESGLTKEMFENLFSVAITESQTRGEHQQGKSGKFRTKKLSELSWRGLLIKLFLEKTATITCKCDKDIPKKTVQAVIKHIERRHRNQNKEITLNTRDLKILEGITWDRQCSTSNNAHFVQ